MRREDVENEGGASMGLNIKKLRLIEGGEAEERLEGGKFRDRRL